MDQEIDAEFDDIVQQITNILQTERDRLVDLGNKLTSRGRKVSYHRTEQFSKLSGMLRETQIGKFEEDPPHPIVSSCADDKTCVDKSRSRKRAISHARSLYDELVATLETREFPCYEPPHSIITLPEQKCFAIFCPRRLAFVSPSAKVLSCHMLRYYDRKKKADYCPLAIARNPLNDQLICVDNGDIKSLILTDWPCTSEFIESNSRIVNAHEAALGLAVSASTNRLFTGFGRYIQSFSLADWQPRGKWQMNLMDKSNCPFVLGASGGKLFFREKNFDTKLYTVHINEADGKLDLDSETVFADRFFSLRDVAFDAYENVLAVDDRLCSFQIFNKTGECLSKVPCFTRGAAKGMPVSLATMTVPSGESLFSFNDGQTLCSDVVAVADYRNSKILFFGNSQNNS